MQIFLATCTECTGEGQSRGILVTEHMAIASSSHSSSVSWGVEHVGSACHGSLGSIQPKRSCSKWGGSEAQADLACSASSLSRGADISWKGLTQIIVLSCCCFVTCFLRCSLGLLFIPDRGHVCL